MCLYPRTMPNRKYVKNKKNGGVIPPVSDERLLNVPIECGNCIECRKKKARDWSLRLMEDIKLYKNGHFVTLTFSNEKLRELIINDKDLKDCRKLKNMHGYRLDNMIATVAVKYFRERWRRIYKKSPRHWLVTELGHKGTENIHLHGIIWADDISRLSEIWGYGYVWDGYNKYGKLVNYVNGSTINYIVKYLSKQDTKHKHYKSIVLCTAGIGKNYTINNSRNKFKGDKTELTYKTEKGHKIMMPSYWKRKLYSDHERELLWLKTLDLNKWYVMGEECKSEIEAGKLRQWYRKQNIEMGYRGYINNEEEMQRENEFRRILIEKRINASGGPSGMLRRG